MSIFINDEFIKNCFTRNEKLYEGLSTNDMFIQVL